MSTLTETSVQVKPTQLGYFSIEYHTLGQPDECIALPICSSCSKPIANLAEGLLIVEENWDEFHQNGLVPVGTINDDKRPLQRFPVKAMHFFHKGACDVIHGDASIPLDQIFVSDQRFEYEKRLEADND